MHRRRDFMKHASQLALAPTIPGYLTRTARAATPDRDGRVLVVIEFPDLATAQSWYHSDAYAPALALRGAVGPRALTIVDGIAPEISAG